MSDLNERISEIEEFILFSKEAADRGASNLPTTERVDKKNYNKSMGEIDYWYFMQAGDQHYFVSRILFLNHVHEYSCFCAQQSVENYLKAYLRYKKKTVPSEHNLFHLLEECKAENNGDTDFIDSPHLAAIVQKYNPFYEFARYPVQNIKPKGSYVIIHPYDIFALDYFILKMREILKIPDNTWDILKDGHYSLHQSQTNSPGFYNTFFVRNINFPDQELRP